MGEEGKKISFGFSKLKKPTNLVKPVVVEKKEVEYVDSFDGARGKFSYKGSVREEPAKKDLVIPLLGTKTALEVIKSRLEEKKQAEIKKVEIKQEPSDSPVNGSADQIVKSEPNDDPTEIKQLSIEELAAKEIIAEIQGNHEKEETTNGMVITQDEKTKPSFEGQTEATLEDYENVPITEYGLAMLRGMGWKPDKKKDPKDEVELPVPRPKGLGLGADKVLPKPSAENEDLTIAVKSYVKFVSGSNNGRYGQVQDVDAETNRVTVKLALGGVITVSENILVPVTKKEYEKNSKIINSAKYEQYKELSDKALAEQRSEAARKRNDDKNSHRKEKYERSREKRKSSESDDGEHKKRHKRKKHHHGDRDSSFSDEEKDRKHKKKNNSESDDGEREKKHKRKKHNDDRDSSFSDEEKDRKHKKKNNSESDDGEHKKRHKHEKHRHRDHDSSDEEKDRKHKKKNNSESDDGERKKKHKRKKDHHGDHDSSFSDEEKDRKHKKKNKKDKSRSSSRDGRHKKKKRKKYSSDSESPPAHRSRDYDSHKSKSSRR